MCETGHNNMTFTTVDKKLHEYLEATDTLILLKQLF